MKKVYSNTKNLKIDLEKVGIDVSKRIRSSENCIFDFPQKPKWNKVDKLAEDIKYYNSIKGEEVDLELITDEETLRCYDGDFNEKDLKETKMKVIVSVNNTSSYILFQ